MPAEWWNALDVLQSRLLAEEAKLEEAKARAADRAAFANRQAAGASITAPIERHLSRLYSDIGLAARPWRCWQHVCGRRRVQALARRPRVAAAAKPVSMTSTRPTNDE